MFTFSQNSFSGYEKMMQEAHFLSEEENHKSINKALKYIVHRRSLNNYFTLFVGLVSFTLAYQLWGNWYYFITCFIGGMVVCSSFVMNEQILRKVRRLDSRKMNTTAFLNKVHDFKEKLYQVWYKYDFLSALFWVMTVLPAYDYYSDGDPVSWFKGVATVVLYCVLSVLYGPTILKKYEDKFNEINYRMGHRYDLV